MAKKPQKPRRFPVSALSRLVKEHKMEGGVLMTWANSKPGLEEGVTHIVTYGVTVQICDWAAQAGALIAERFLKSDRGLAPLPNRVKLLQTELKTTKAELKTTKAELEAAIAGIREARQEINRVRTLFASRTGPPVP